MSDLISEPEKIFGAFVPARSDLLKHLESEAADLENTHCGTGGGGAALYPG